MTEQKKYITSKSKTFEKGSDLYDIKFWVESTMDTKINNSPFATDPILTSKQKYKITITNLK